MSKLLITSVNEQIPKLSNSEGIDENTEIHFTFFFFFFVRKSENSRHYTLETSDVCIYLR